MGIALASAPIIAYLFGKAITGVFAWRYAIGGVVGMALLFGLICFRVFRGSAIAAWLIVLVVSISFLVSARTKAHKLADGRSSLRDLISWFGKIGDPSEPLVIGDSPDVLYLVLLQSTSYETALCLSRRYETILEIPGSGRAGSVALAVISLVRLEC